MNGLMKRYNESLRNTPGPVTIEDIPKVKIDYSGLLNLAKSKNISVDELPIEEKLKFITELMPGEIEKVIKNMTV